MKLKIYLRGLGIGIIVTALIMGISLGGKEEMTDEEVIARARELGMVESEADKGLYAAVEESRTEEQQETIRESESETETELQTESQSETETESETESESATESESETTKETETETQSGEEVVSGQVVSITIVSGDDSALVSRKLEEAGLVVSATSYNKFLCENGYERKLSPGTYEIAIGSSEETIAKIITKSK